MDKKQIEDTIKSLAKSQGFYSRMWNQMKELKEKDPTKYDECLAELESLNFKDEVDMILFFEG